MIALQEFQEIYPDLWIKHFLGDSAMDVDPIYILFLNRLYISSVIDLNDHRGRKPKVGDNCFDQPGQPICPGEIFHDLLRKLEKGIHNESEVPLS